MESQRSLNDFRTFSQTGISNQIGPHTEEKELKKERERKKERRQLHANKKLVGLSLNFSWFLTLQHNDSINGATEMCNAKVRKSSKSISGKLACITCNYKSGYICDSQCHCLCVRVFEFVCTTCFV